MTPHTATRERGAVPQNERLAPGPAGRSTSGVETTLVDHGGGALEAATQLGEVDARLRDLVERREGVVDLGAVGQGVLERLLAEELLRLRREQELHQLFGLVGHVGVADDRR